MTIEETGTVMDILTIAYPMFYSKQSDYEKTDATKLWAVMFADDDGGLVAAAVKALIATKSDGFPPDIGQVKAKMHEIETQDELPDSKVWDLVSKAVRDTDFQNPSKQFSKLPPEIQAAIGSPAMLREWGMIDADTFQTVVASNFLKSYRTIKKRQRDTALIPADVKAILSGITKKMELGDGESK